MRLIFTIAIFSAAVVVNAAGSSFDSLPLIRLPFAQFNIAAKETSDTPVMTGITCPSTITPVSPLLVVDGVVGEWEAFKHIDPDDIASVGILKSTSTAALYGCRAPGEVILVTTRALTAKKFIIKDILTGEGVPFATVSIVSGTDTVKANTDTKGVLIIEKGKKFDQYRVIVSSAGYKTFSTVAKGKEQQILLERDVKICQEIVVIAYPAISCRASCGSCTTVSKCSMKSSGKKDNIVFLSENFPDHNTVVSLYPNPVQKHNSFNIELKSEREDVIQLTVYDMNGKLVFIQSKKLFAGLNRIVVNAAGRWAGGVYNVLVKNQRGIAVKTEKLVIQ